MGRLIPHDEDEDGGESVAVPVAYTDEDLPFDPTQFGALADEIDEFSFDGCLIKRNGRELALFEGQSFWVHPIIPADLHNAYTRFAGGVQDESMSGMSAPFDALCEGLSRCVVGWTLVDPVTGEPCEQPYRNPAALRSAPTEILYWIVATALKGETPDARPNGSTPRRGGSGTRRYSGQKTRSTSTAPRRR